MNDKNSKQPNTDSFVDGFASEDRAAADIDEDYVSGKFSRWYLENRESDDTADAPEDMLAQRRLLQQIADNHKSKLGDSKETVAQTSQTSDRSFFSKTPMAIAASVFAAAVALVFVFNSPQSPDVGGELRSGAKQSVMYVGELSDSEAFQSLVASKLGEIESATVSVDDLKALLNTNAPDVQQALSSIDKSEVTYVSVDIKTQDDIDGFATTLSQSMTPELPVTKAWVDVVNNQQGTFVPVDSSVQRLIYLFQAR